MKFWIFILLVSFLEWSQAVEVHFEATDSGFFLKHSARQPPVSPEISTVQQQQQQQQQQHHTTKPKLSQDSVLSVDRFTVVQTTQPVSIRASYGPFSTKQTVPARYIVPDAIEAQGGDHVNNTTAALMELQQANLHLDISAHLVRPTIPRDSPVLRVLFHAGADPGGHLQRQRICVLLHVSMGTRTPLKGRCMPEGEDGVCVAEVVIPSNWWPPLPPPERDAAAVPVKVPQRIVQVSYSVFEPPSRNPEQCEPKVQIQPLTSFAQVPLVQAQAAYKDLRADEALTILIPQVPLFPMSKIHVPVFLHQQPDQNIAVFIVRARVKAGMRILGATTSSDQWNISIEKENVKHTVARVTAFRKDQDPDSSGHEADSENANKVTEVFSWLLEVANDTKEDWDGGKIVWSISYVYDGPKLKDASAESTGSTPEETRRKLIAKLEINKDDIQAVLPISKNWELMNTAVLTGRQVSQAMKVFIVTQAGKVADVTLQCSCHAEDESVIKVSSSCSSVYVDGSELRGSSNASVIVKYGTYLGLARFIVWMPEIPLEVYVSDFRLSQIKGWKVPDDHHYSHGKTRRRKKRAFGWNHHTDDFMNVLGAEKASCRARYQQSPVEVYARFLAIDQNSGRVSYLISRRTGLRVTDLVQPLLRVADPKIASLKGRILQGKSMGRTDVQVLSPITGRVMGAKEIRVGSDKVSLTRLIVRVVSGLQLTITPDGAIENGYIAETSVTRRLTAQYQEGLLDIDLEFSDGARTPLRDISVDDYFLLVESLDTEVVAFAPMLASHHPRVIAVGEGNGDLLRVTLLVSEECRLRRSLPMSKPSKSAPGPLASALAAVQVDFNTGETVGKSDTVQNDGIMGRERKTSSDSGDLGDIIGIPLRDDSHHEPTVQARQHRGSINSIDGLRHKPSPHGDMTSMEIGMYVLLTAFCFAIIIFVISCVVYASKFRPITIESGLDPAVDQFSPNGILKDMKRPRESTTNAHDWVWLGRSTMDRSSVAQESIAGNVFENPRDSRIRITSNPMNLNYSDPNDVLENVSSFDNANNIPMACLNAPIINSSTYTKNPRRPNAMNHSPPPLPPHNRLSTNNLRPEYRPPVPPHRNIGVTANVNNPTDPGMKVASPNGQTEAVALSPAVTAAVPAPVVKRHHHKHHRNSNHAQNRRSQVHGNIDLIRSYDRPPDHRLNFTQEEISVALKNVAQQQQQQNSPEQTFSPQDVSPMNAEDELHMAERLVESAAQQQKTVFQFDSLTPKRDPLAKGSNSNEMQDDIQINALKIDEPTEVKRRHKKQSSTSTPLKSTSTNDSTSNISSSDDNGGFITPPGEEKSRKHQVKRATVVGNPMFSSTSDGEIGPGESLGLDDLDMDYEQIMHYFDNLKESNA